MITGETTATAPGTALLLAAAPLGKGRLIDATRVLGTLAACPPSSLLGTASGTVVELADPTEQQAVLTRIRAAAAAPGPLTLLLAGQLHHDSRQHALHLALARTTPSTLRYTALPWAWLAGELKPRRPGTTTVLADLVAAPDTWQKVCAEGLTLGLGISLYGRVTPPPPRHRTATPAYLQAVASIWRSGLNPPLTELHAKAAAALAGQGEALLLAADPTQAPFPTHAPPGTAPVAPATTEDPLPALLAAARAGQHDQAAALAARWEGWAVQAYGAGSEQAIHWLEVRADLARVAGDAARSCELWMAAVDARLTRHQAPDAPEVEAAVDRAHHQWQAVRDAARARALGPRLVALRRRVPGRRPGATEAVQRRLEFLHTMPQTLSTLR
ncbi:hypothetical protein ABZ743_29190 [Streptomyces sp. NPDC006662]|uniref:hypothetical protein n=1 Tax=Streptomyces sp. NPDC006662 TaxID=3156902 RepID=UPI0034023729